MDLITLKFFFLLFSPRQEVKIPTPCNPFPLKSDTENILNDQHFGLLTGHDELQHKKLPSDEKNELISQLLLLLLRCRQTIGIINVKTRLSRAIRFMDWQAYVPRCRACDDFILKYEKI
jgi:hypothetical protein